MRYEVVYEQGGKRVVRRYKTEFVIDDVTALAHIQRGLRVYNGFLQKHEAPRKAIRFRLLSDKWEPPSYEKVTFANR